MKISGCPTSNATTVCCQNYVWTWIQAAEERCISMARRYEWIVAVNGNLCVELRRQRRLSNEEPPDDQLAAKVEDVTLTGTSEWSTARFTIQGRSIMYK